MNWLQKIAEYEDHRERIELAARSNPYPFQNWFPNGTRTHIPFQASEEEVDEDVAAVLENSGCVITDYRAGYCQKGNQTLRISKAIEQAKREEIAQLDVKNQQGEIYDYEREINRINQFYDNAMNEFVNSPLRIDAAKNQYYIVISQDPHDVARMSTDQEWTSCMNLEDGAHSQDVYCEIRSGGLIAYLVREEGEQNFTNPATPEIYRRYLGDTEVENALARIHIRRFENTKGQSLAIPEQSVYGNEVTGFTEAVQAWLNERQQNTTPGWYSRKGGGYSDTHGKGKLVLPNKEEEILQWIRGEVDAKQVAWIISDNTGEEEDRTFESEEQASEWIDRLDEHEFYIYNPINEDEEAKAEERYDVRKKVVDHTSQMVSQALRTVITAPRNTYSEALVLEVIQIIKDQYSASPQNRILGLLAENYPEHMDMSQIKQIDKRKYYQQMLAMEEGPEKEQFINDEIQAAEAWLLPTLSSAAEKEEPEGVNYVSDHHLRRLIQEYERATDVQSKVNAKNSVALHWAVIFNDKVLDPLGAIFGDPTNPNARPLPESVVRNLVNFGMNVLPTYEFPGTEPKASVNRRLSRRQTEYTDQTLVRIAHLFSMGRADSPSVQTFYESLLPKWGPAYYDLGQGDRAEINVDTLGWSIAKLGPNGKQFLPFLKGELQKAEQIYVRFQQERSSEREMSIAKKNVEKHLYIIEILEKGQASGKYRFSANWLQKIAMGCCLYARRGRVG